MSLSRIILPVLILCITAASGSAQELVPEESPSALFASEIGDTDVDLFFTGFWKASLMGSFSFGYDSDQGTLVPAVFPDFAPGFLFRQIPDLTLSLWIREKYFFETTIQEDSSLNTFMLGYRGAQDEFLRSVLIGNTGVQMGTYGFLNFPDQPSNSLGASAFMRSESTVHELMIRYEPSETTTVTFLGNNRREETLVGLPEYLSDRRFLLPDGNVEGLIIYIQDTEGTLSGGDGNRYRRLEPGEAYVSETDGLIEFVEPRTGRVLVYYTKGPDEVGDPALGTGFLAGEDGNIIDITQPAVDFAFGITYLNIPPGDWGWQVTIEGNDALMIFEPGSFSPFALLNTYSLPENAPAEEWRNSCVLLPKDDRYADGSAVPISVDTGAGFFTVESAGSDLRDPARRYPFVVEYPLLYGPKREISEGYYGEVLELTVLEPAEGFFIDPGAVPGSVSVRINGIAEPRFTVDYAVGEVTLGRRIFPEDTVEITYRTTGPGSGGNIMMGIGNRFVLNPAWEIDLALGLNWNLASGSYTTRPGENPGSVLLTSGFSYGSDRFNASFDAGLSFATSDTGGLFRGPGMEEGGFYIGITEKNIYPSSVPASNVGGHAVGRANRGRLIYTNFRTSSLLTGSVLMPYTWDAPADQVYSYETGQKPGPAAAGSGGSSADNTVMVMDFEVSSSNHWVGAQIPLTADGGYIDLSGAESLSFYWLGEDLPADLECYVHLGAAGEDLDDDGILDKESGPYARGFPFNDPANGAVLLVGTGPDNGGDGVVDSEDMNGNGILDAERNDQLVEKGVSPLPGSSWTLAEVSFDSADRDRLHAVSAFRIVLVYTGTGDASGRLMVGGISVESSPYYGEADPPGTIKLRELYEFQVSPPPPQLLTEAFPEVLNDFHPGDSSQKVLEIEWSNMDPGEEWTATGYTTPLPLEEYRNLEFYYRLPHVLPASGGTISVEITGSDGSGLKVGLPAEVRDEWAKVSVDLAGDTVLVNGSDFPGASVTRTDTTGTLSKIVIRGTGTTDGTMYIDEIHLKNAHIAVSAGAAGEAEYTYNGELVSINGVPVVSNLRLREQTAFIGDRFASGFAESYAPGSISTATEAEADILFVGTAIDFELLWAPPRLSLSGGHELTIPSIPSPVVFTDRYSRQHDGEDYSFSRSNSLIVDIFGAAGLTLVQETALLSNTLTQGWSGGIVTTLSVPVTFSADTSFEQVSAGYAEPISNYFAGWITGYRFFAPWHGDPAPEQAWEADAGLRIDTLPVGGRLDHVLGFRQYGAAARRQRNYASVAGELPMVFLAETPAEWTLTPRYGRSSAHIMDTPGARGFGTGFFRFGTGYAAAEYFYGSIPFYEIFAPVQGDYFTSGSSDFLDADYTAEAGLNLSRLSSSRIMDLFVPSAAGLGFIRALERRGINIEDTLTWDLSLRMTALNLFGRRGLRPLVRFYETDEFTTLIELSQTQGIGTEHLSTSFTLEHILTFLGGNNEELIIDNTLEIGNTDEKGYSTSDRVEIRFTWRTPAEFSLDLDFIDEKNRRSLYFEHIETLETTLGPRFDPPVNGLDFGILVSHSSSLVVPETAHLLARIALGLDRSSASLWVFGLHGGLEFKISF